MYTSEHLSEQFPVSAAKDGATSAAQAFSLQAAPFGHLEVRLSNFSDKCSDPESRKKML
jgi:hypothetical protein